MTLGFRILGPFEVHVDGVPLVLGPRQQRALLAALTLRANELVSSERLIDELWPEDPPDTADHLVHVYVSRLRKALGEEGRTSLVTRPPGYELLIERGQLDLHRFEDLIGEARSSVERERFDEASRTFREALALWRGPALADLVSETFARAEAERLNEQRQSATEDMIRSEIAAGRADLVPELKALVAQHPLRERLRGFLMVALYREGQQAEALRVYDEGRVVLADELGIDPSRELRELHRRVLVQDPTLLVELPPQESPTAPGALSGTALAAAYPTRRLVIGLAAAVVIVSALLLANGLSRRGDTGSSKGGAALVRIGTGSGEPLDRIDVTGSPSLIAVDGSTLWVADQQARTVARVDTASGTIQTIGSVGMPYAIAAGSDRAWVLDPFGGTVTMLHDADLPTTIKRLHAPLDAVFAFDSLWVLEGIDEAVLRLDPTDGRLQERIQLPAGSGPIRITASASAIWVLNGLDRTLSQIDVPGGLVANAVPLLCPPPTQTCRPTDIAAGPAALWISMQLVGAVQEFSVDGAPMRTVAGLSSPSDIGADANGAWVLVGGGLIRLSNEGRIIERWRAPQPVAGLGDDGAEPWVSLTGDQTKAS